MKSLKRFKISLYLLLIILATISLYAKEPFFTTKLYPNWFNPLGGLANYYGGYATLTIDKWGGVMLEDNFYSKDKEFTNKHWLTIDEAWRGKGKKWKNELFLKITFHYIIKSNGKEEKATGSGSFKFPPVDSEINLLNSYTQNSVVNDEYANAHGINTFLKKTFIKRKRGEVTLIRDGHTIKARRGMQLKVGDIIRTLDSTAEIVLGGRVIIKIKPHSEILIPKVTPPLAKKTSFIKMTYGVIFAHVKRELDSFKVYVPQAVCGVRGTKFELSHDPKVMKSCVKVYEHSVWFSDLQKRKTVIVHEGEKSCVVNGGLPSNPQPYIKSKKASAQKVFHFSGKTQDNFPATLLLKIAKDGTISGIYSVNGSKFQKGKPCQLSARIPYRGKIEKSSLRAKGVLEATQAWCEGSKSIKQSIPATPFILSYKKNKGLLLDIGEQHYRVIFTKPAINPLKGIEK